MLAGARSRRYALLALLTVQLTSPGAAAAPPTRTERLAAACDGCHGPGGAGSGAIPALAGQDPAQLQARLEAWRESPDDGMDHLMVRFARALDAPDVAALAQWYGRDPDPAAAP